MIGAFLGAIYALIPRLLDIWDKRLTSKSRAAQEALDHKREMEMMRLQAELAPPPPGPDVHAADLADLRDARRPPQPSSGFRLLDHAHNAKGVIGRWPISLSFLGYTFVDVVISTVRPTVTYLVIGVWAVCKILQFRDGGGLEWFPAEFDMVMFIITFYFGGRALQREKRRK